MMSFKMRFRFAILFVLVLFLALLAAPAFAATFTASGELDGETHPWDDYQIFMEAGATIEVLLQCIPASPLDPEFDILDGNGVVVGNDDDSGTPSCAQASSSYLMFTAAASGIYTVRASSYEIISDNDPTDVNADGFYLLTITGNFTLVGGASVPVFTDGRINNNDQWASYAVYCTGGNIEVYAIAANGAGTLAFSTTPDEVAAVGVPSENTVIEEGAGIRLFRLSSGEFQLVGPADAEGKVYNVLFSNCSVAGVIRTFMTP